jgi:thymidylate kinase
MGSNNDDPHAAAVRPFLITFSGIDGAGKTTQIEHLSRNLQNQGLRVVRFTFWDHVAIWSKVRAEVGHRSADLLGGTDETTEPAFVPKNNKHIRTWYLTALRSGLYVADIARLRHLLSSQSTRTSDVVIFDRYIYDQIANIYSKSWALRIYCRALLSQTPVPDLAFILDASPDAAFARKPEYPLEFLYLNRGNFLRLGELVPQLITIPDAEPEEVKREIYARVQSSQLVERVVHQAKTGFIEKSSVVRQQSSCRAQNQPTTGV